MILYSIGLIAGATGVYINNPVLFCAGLACFWLYHNHQQGGKHE